MSIDSSVTPITNSVTNQLDGLKQSTGNQVSYVRTQVKALEEKVAEYNNKATKNKDEIIQQIKKIQSQITEKVNNTVAQATDRLTDVTTTAATAKAEADALYSLVSPLMSPPGASLGSLADFCTAIANLAKRVGTSTQAKKIDAAGAVTAVSTKSASIKSDISELNSLLNKAKSITTKFK